MKIIISFPDDIKEKTYFSLLNYCSSMIREPKQWKKIPQKRNINNKSYLLTCKKGKYINFNFDKLSDKEINEIMQEHVDGYYTKTFN